MVAHYEQMRGTALDPLNQRLVTLPGLALFLRQGMTAWMCASSNCVIPPAHEPDRVVTQPPPLPQSLRAQLAMILAGMILSQHQEITT